MSTASEFDGAAGGARAGRDDDGGDESDSETPGACTVVLYRLGGVGAASANGGSSGGGGSGSSAVRVRIATFSPTPHYSEVVTLLKVPFPLSDIIVDRLQVCRRAVNAQGIAAIARPCCDLDVVGVTAEEIKDVVSSTGPLAGRA
ncbi:hypothetical protein BGW80DRAFT_1462344 [Lactifluus volemus]|nr:hypothetical protein BGW80DRAFT_1462344 [Lactifluus volemus]